MALARNLHFQMVLQVVNASLLDAGPAEYPSPLFTLIPIDILGIHSPKSPRFASCDDSSLQSIY
jgi:hypothetical protein